MVDKLKALEEGIRLFNDRYFFEAHDVLEEAWMEITNSKERLFYQGLIQLAVGFYHLEGGNLKGADDVLSRGIAKLRQYEPEFMGVRLTDLLWKSRKCLSEVQATRRGERVRKEFDPSTVPVIRYEENKEA